jgi:hypothetical protein
MDLTGFAGTFFGTPPTWWLLIPIPRQIDTISTTKSMKDTKVGKILPAEVLPHEIICQRLPVINNRTDIFEARKSSCR